MANNLYLVLEENRGFDNDGSGNEHAAIGGFYVVIVAPRDGPSHPQLPIKWRFR